MIGVERERDCQGPAVKPTEKIYRRINVFCLEPLAFRCLLFSASVIFIT